MGLIHELFSNCNYELQYSVNVTDIGNCMNYIPTNLAWLCCNRKYHLALYSLSGKKLVLLFPAGLKTFIIYFQFSL